MSTVRRDRSALTDPSPLARSRHPPIRTAPHVKLTSSPECPIAGAECRIPSRSINRTVRWDSLEDKARWLDGASSLDAMRCGIQRVAMHLCGTLGAEARTRAMQRWVRDRIRYVFDWRTSQAQRGEEFADAETTIVRAFEDCDGKSRLFVALVRAAEKVRPARVEARIRPIFRREPWEFVHVQAEVRWPGSHRHPRAMAGGWLLSELILAGCEIGQDPDDVPRGADGQRVIA